MKWIEDVAFRHIGDPASFVAVCAEPGPMISKFMTVWFARLRNVRSRAALSPRGFITRQNHDRNIQH